MRRLNSDLDPVGDMEEWSSAASAMASNSTHDACKPVTPLYGGGVWATAIDADFRVFSTPKSKAVRFEIKQHRMARWRHRCSIDVGDDGDQHTMARVVRDVGISRRDRGKFTDYFTGTSVGRNEAWILNEIAHRL